MSFLTHEQNGLVWLTSSLLDGVCHGFSTRQGGVSQPPFDTLNLAPGRDDDPAAVRAASAALWVSIRPAQS